MCLKEKYSNKPGQLKSIMESDPTCIRPDRQVQVWQDRDLSCTNENKEGASEVKKRMMERAQDARTQPLLPFASIAPPPLLGSSQGPKPSAPIGLRGVGGGQSFQCK